MNIQDEITLELARLQREATDRVRRKIASQQLGEAWVGLDKAADHTLDEIDLCETLALSH